MSAVVSVDGVLEVRDADGRLLVTLPRAAVAGVSRSGEQLLLHRRDGTEVELMAASLAEAERLAEELRAVLPPNQIGAKPRWQYVLAYPGFIAVTALLIAAMVFAWQCQHIQF